MRFITVLITAVLCFFFPQAHAGTILPEAAQKWLTKNNSYDAWLALRGQTRNFVSENRRMIQLTINVLITNACNKIGTNSETTCNCAGDVFAVSYSMEKFYVDIYNTVKKSGQSEKDAAERVVNFYGSHAKEICGNAMAENAARMVNPLPH